jgi:CopG family nickel-responsive transcriptional regulator
MSDLTRFGISIDSGLLDKFDSRNEEKGYQNRSEAIRDLIRDCLVEEAWREHDGEMVGVVTLVYDHHKLELPKRLTDEQHKQHSIILSTLHIHLDPHNCLEVLLLRGEAKQIKTIADNLISLKGIKHGKLTMTTTGEWLE